MPAFASSAARMPPAAPTPTITTSAFSVAMATSPNFCCWTFVGLWAEPGTAGLRFAPAPLDKRAGILPVAVHDRIGRHVGERLDGERRIKAAHGRMGRRSHDEEIRDVPAL